MDIKDLSLRKLDSFSKADLKIVVSKHLCGVATDFALNSILNTLIPEQETNPGKKNSPGTIIVMIALCCHHLCSFNSFNKGYLAELGVDKEDFKAISKMSSWATCKFRKQEPSVEKHHSSERNIEKEDFSRNLDPATKENLGYCCKDFINYGRVTLLKRFGFTVTLHKYADEKFTLENKLLFAIRKSTKVEEI